MFTPSTSINSCLASALGSSLTFWISFVAVASFLLESIRLRVKPSTAAGLKTFQTRRRRGLDTKTNKQWPPFFVSFPWVYFGYFLFSVSVHSTWRYPEQSTRCINSYPREMSGYFNNLLSLLHISTLSSPPAQSHLSSPCFLHLHLCESSYLSSAGRKVSDSEPADSRSHILQYLLTQGQRRSPWSLDLIRWTSECRGREEIEVHV